MFRVSNESHRALVSAVLLLLYKGVLKIKSLNVTIQMKAIEQFPVLLLITLCRVPEVRLLSNIFLEFCFLIC